MDDKRKRRVVFFFFEDAATRMLNYLEDSEDLKVGLSDLKEQLETREEASFSIMQIAKQASNERGQKIFQIFRQEDNEVGGYTRGTCRKKHPKSINRRCSRNSRS